ncbi:DUF72 domain-containing protein [Streptomyces cirratus]
MPCSWGRPAGSTGTGRGPLSAGGAPALVAGGVRPAFRHGGEQQTPSTGCPPPRPSRRARRTPDGFVMAVQASRFLTHIKRLRDPEEPVRRLMTHSAALGPRLGPVHSPTATDAARGRTHWDACLACFPAGVRVAGGAPHESWWDAGDPVGPRRAGRRPVLGDRHSRRSPRCGARPTGVTYGFHEGRAQPWPGTGPGCCGRGPAGSRTPGPRGPTSYAYFNNDPGGAAVKGRRGLRRMVGAAAVPV